MMQASTASVMAVNSYRYQAELLVDYLLADPFVPYTSVLCGIFMCKMAYDLTQLISSFYFKCYASLTKIQRIEWNNRGMSSAHAVFITIMSLYLVFFSDLYSDHFEGLVTLRSSNISTFTLGVSVGYFMSDLAMIFWLYPLLGGMEYVFHHLLSLCAISYAMLTGEGQLYTYMVLISEATTPGVNLRWFLDTGGMKRSKAYLINGVVMFFAWLVARILLFIYLFYHIYFHYDQIEQMQTFGYFLAFVVPAALTVITLFSPFILYLHHHSPPPRPRQPIPPRRAPLAHLHAGAGIARPSQAEYLPLLSSLFFFPSFLSLFLSFFPSFFLLSFLSFSFSILYLRPLSPSLLLTISLSLSLSLFLSLFLLCGYWTQSSPSCPSAFVMLDAIPASVTIMEFHLGVTRPSRPLYLCNVTLAFTTFA